MRQRGPAHAAGAFAREWNAAFAIVIAIGALLFVAGQSVLGAMTIGLGAAALVLRHSAMRRQGRGFYGEEK